MIINILPQTQYNFSHLGSAATQDVIVADNIPVAGARTVALSVRVHQVDLASGANFFFMVYGVDPSRTDGTVFISSTSVNVSAITSTNPNLRETTIITDPVYPFMRVVLRATGGLTSKVYFETSADLVVRQATPPEANEQQAFIQNMIGQIYGNQPPESRGTLSEFPDSLLQPELTNTAGSYDPLTTGEPMSWQPKCTQIWPCNPPASPGPIANTPKRWAAQTSKALGIC